MLVADRRVQREPMIVVGSRQSGAAEYDLLLVLRIVFNHVPSAYVRSTKTADDAAAQRARKMVESGVAGEGPLTIEQVSGIERRKVEGWGGLVIDVRLRDHDEAFIGFLGPRQLMIRGDCKVIPNATIQGIAQALHQAGYAEVKVE